MTSNVISIEARQITVGGADILELIGQARVFVAAIPAVIDASSAPDAQELLADLVKLKGMIEKQRVEAKAPFLETGKKIDAAAKLYTKPLGELEDIVRGMLQVYATEQARLRTEAFEAQRVAEVAASKEAAATGRTPALAASAAVAIPDFGGVKTRDYPELVIDLAILPKEYMVPDEPRIRALLENGEVVPGAKIVMVARVVAR